MKEVEDRNKRELAEEEKKKEETVPKGILKKPKEEKEEAVVSDVVERDLSKTPTGPSEEEKPKKKSRFAREHGL